MVDTVRSTYTYVAGRPTPRSPALSAAPQPHNSITPRVPLRKGKEILVNVRHALELGPSSAIFRSSFSSRLLVLQATTTRFLCSESSYILAETTTDAHLKEILTTGVCMANLAASQVASGVCLDLRIQYHNISTTTSPVTIRVSPFFLANTVLSVDGRGMQLCLALSNTLPKLISDAWMQPS